ncbi:hypothetical protein E2C01_045830 [Portunus trituberculatus]|uniref:Uncharacterized protein n=1 Tax=Portunus trituberculatus TaxID=210409 RepID=A0A5B7FZB1_PORTR|nr:hypothetical protein [Portunus trituberculatus]
MITAQTDEALLMLTRHILPDLLDKHQLQAAYARRLRRVLTLSLAPGRQMLSLRGGVYTSHPTPPQSEYSGCHKDIIIARNNKRKNK